MEQERLPDLVQPLQRRRHPPPDHPGRDWSAKGESQGEAERGAKDGRSEATTVVCIVLSLPRILAFASLAPLIQIISAILFAHRS